MAENPQAQNPQEDQKKKVEQVSLEDYQALKDAQAKKMAKKKELPKAVKILLASPIIVIFLFGLFYIPYLFIGAATNDEPVQEEEASINP